MKDNKKSLQNLTKTDKKISSLLAQKKIFKADLDKLFNDQERIIFETVLVEKINTTKGHELDEILEKLDDILPKGTKNQLWENNHLQITISISKQIEETGKMPTKNQIAADSGLSRQTVYKHLKGYAEHPLYSEQIKQFKFMADRVLAKVIKQAAQGDMKAARLYFDVMGNLNGQTTNSTLIKNQNNYIQINGKILSQEKISHLSVEQLAIIEDVFEKV